jgi:hypothetical protein
MRISLFGMDFGGGETSPVFRREKSETIKKAPETGALKRFDFDCRPFGRAQKATSSFLRGPFSSGRLS